MDLKTEEKRERARREHDEKMFDDLWRTVPGAKPTSTTRACGSPNPGTGFAQ